MTNAKDKENKQEKLELKSCPVAAALAPVRQLKKGEQVSALIFEGGGTKGAAYAGVVKALDAAGLVKDVKHFAGASAGAMTAAILVGTCCHACQLPTPRRRDESHKLPLYYYNRS